MYLDTGILRLGGYSNFGDDIWTIYIVGDNYKMLVADLAISVAKIYFFCITAIFKRCYQHRNSVTDIQNRHYI